VVLDQGDDIDDRVRSRDTGTDEKRTITSGFGGAGLFSDGKLCLSHRIGSTIAHRFPAHEVGARQHAIDELLRGGEAAPLHGADQATARQLTERARDLGLDYLHYPVRHIGSDQLVRMTTALRRRVETAARIQCGVLCVDVRPANVDGYRWEVHVEAPGGKPVCLYGKNIVLAPGKIGASWLRMLGARLNLARAAAQPKLGFRLEGPRGMLDPLLAVATDPKVIWKAAAPRSEVRTHCVCYGGDVVPAAYQDLTLVGGHSTSDHAHDRTNTAVLATAGDDFPMTAGQARSFVQDINRRSGECVTAQRLGDFLTGTPTTCPVTEAASGFSPSIPDAAPGDLSALFPAPIVALLRDYLHRLAQLCPQVIRQDNMLYGPAVERWADRFEVTDTMQSPGYPGLYLVGDGPGLTGGIIGAADSGWLAGDAIAAASIPAVAAS
jgi:uncharacterized FAD-dependent dehydrogenase